MLTKRVKYLKRVVLIEIANLQIKFVIIVIKA